MRAVTFKWSPHATVLCTLAFAAVHFAYTKQATIAIKRLAAIKAGQQALMLNYFAAMEGMEVLPALRGALSGHNAILEACCPAQAHLHHHDRVKDALQKQPIHALQAFCPIYPHCVSRFYLRCCLEVNHY